MKTIFIAFAIEDERMRDFLKGQSLLTVIRRTRNCQEFWFANRE